MRFKNQVEMRDTHFSITLIDDGIYYKKVYPHLN